MCCNTDEERDTYNDYNAFKPLQENPVILDFTGCKTLGEVHQVLKISFGFPEYYGENWDALWDCLRDLFYKRGEYVVEIHGYRTMPEELQDYCQTMLEIFDDVHKETPNVTFVMVS